MAFALLAVVLLFLMFPPLGVFLFFCWVAVWFFAAIFHYLKDS